MRDRQQEISDWIVALTVRNVSLINNRYDKYTCREKELLVKQIDKCQDNH